MSIVGMHCQKIGIYNYVQLMVIRNTFTHIIFIVRSLVRGTGYTITSRIHAPFLTVYTMSVTTQKKQTGVKYM